MWFEAWNWPLQNSEVFLFKISIYQFLIYCSTSGILLNQNVPQRLEASILEPCLIKTCEGAYEERV